MLNNKKKGNKSLSESSVSIGLLEDTETKPKFLPPRSDNGSVQQTKPEKVNGGGDSTWMKSDMSNGNLDEKKQPDAQAPPVISDGTVRMKRQIGLAGLYKLLLIN